MYRRFPAFAEAQSKRYIGYNRTLDVISQLERQGSVFVIRHSKAPAVGRMESDPEKVRQLYNLGRKDGENALESLKIWLQTKTRSE